ncbi:MAG: SdrD B-like domain-containing protein, partial [Clostridia bacterium]|nr:SdrD B-like domain-containing protein [Clostridia bacterium]
MHNGRDWAAPGQGLTIMGGVTFATAEEDWRPVAVDYLLKFDDEFLDPEKQTSNSGAWGNSASNGVRYYYYAAKPDGTGWTSDDEMKRALPGDLIYFETLTELRNAGKICVGLLGEVRGLTDNNSPTFYPMIKGSVKMDAVPNAVYMTTHAARGWNVGEIKTYLRGIGRLTDGMTTEEVDAAVDAYVRSYEFPSLCLSRPAPEGFPEESWHIQFDENADPNILDYPKTTYSPDGTVLVDIDGINIGDSCLVVSEFASIDAKVQKTVTEEGVTTSETADQAGYDMDSSQRYADICLNSQIELKKDSGNGSSDEIIETTDVMITVTLPEKLTLDGDVHFNGTYTPPAKHGKPGTVTGGEIFGADGKYEFVQDSENPRIFHLTIHDYQINWADTESNPGGKHTLPEIRFTGWIGSADPANDVQNNDQLVVTATIQTDNDRIRPCSVANGNLDTATLIINKGAVLSILDRAQVVGVDAVLNGDSADAYMTFNMSAANDSSHDATDTVLVAHTPYAEDEFSSFSGTVSVNSFTVDPSQWLNGEVHVYYSTSTAEHTKNDHTTADITAENGWIELTINPDGTVNLPEGVDITAIAVVGTIPAKGRVTMQSEIKLSDAKPDDVLNHSLSCNTMSIGARSFVLDRNISGMTWLDLNKNGLREDDEPAYPGLTVTMLRKNDSGDYVPYGEAYQTVTDENGEYLFSEMPQGVYAVYFTDPDGTVKLSTWLLTMKDEGDDDTIDSDAEPITAASGSIGVLTRAGSSPTYGVKEIVMLPPDQITLHRDAKVHNDAGFYRPDLILKKVVEGEYADRDKPFNFTVNVEGALPDETYDTVLYKGSIDNYEEGSVNGTALLAGYPVQLKADWKLIIKALPAGSTYTITEEDYTSEGYTTTPENANNTLTDDDQSAVFTNTYRAGDLVIKKIIQNGNPDTEFTITIEANLNGTAVAGTYTAEVEKDSVVTEKTVTFTAGKATIKIKGGETWTIHGLPLSTAYTVDEPESEQPKGWELVSKTGDTGTVTGDPAVFTNKYDATGKAKIEGEKELKNKELTADM